MKHSALAELHGNPELSFTVLEITTVLDSDVACNCFAEARGYAVDEALIPMKPVCCCVQLMSIGDSQEPVRDQGSPYCQQQS
ncbi:hypothetical protein [Cyanobium gracile]|uniref:Uncharacterized protein n=1 Tax=Cyanobium gracile UHCC 0281 TaxID=3110309 RepID=A0ABU5SYQ6_9CYAN|nr:hypothetical protein [Cyanobium gracile]MEA5443624.1 hypothetical protein [Cyanobium gracile UHCC 0281]